MSFPTPHLEKLTATLINDKLPLSDRPRVQASIVRYHQWIADIGQVAGSADEVLVKMLALLNAYRNHIDVDLVFDSPNDFLYRQKGQLKLDNSVIEEFLPHLLGHTAVLPELPPVGVLLGPRSSFSAAWFNSSLTALRPGGGIAIRTKNQDFAIAKPLFLRASHYPDFRDAATEQTFISYVAAECKTNLDKTMFQEACATAHNTKAAVAGARYYLLCEWLDMAPQATASTAIDEIIILRMAKRLNSGVRAHYAAAAKRRQLRGEYLAFLEKNPFRPAMFQRFIGHVRELIKDEQPVETDILQLGYF